MGNDLQQKVLVRTQTRDIVVYAQSLKPLSRGGARYHTSMDCNFFLQKEVRSKQM